MSVEYRKGNKLDEKEYGDKKIRQNKLIQYGLLVILSGLAAGFLRTIL